LARFRRQKPVWEEADRDRTGVAVGRSNTVGAADIAPALAEIMADVEQNMGKDWRKVGNNFGEKLNIAERENTMKAQLAVEGAGRTENTQLA